MTPTSMPTNSGVLVSSVPALCGTGACLASDPARPRAKISGANRPRSITMPPATWYQVAAVPRPAKAEPLLLAIVTVFVGGLMVGRTPEYIGKKIRPTEMKYAALYFLTLPVLILTAAALSIGTKVGQEVIFNPGPHGLTEVMYAFTSMANNNGSAFAGLGTAATWYQVVGGIVMLLGRFAPEIFALGLAGSLARQAPVPKSAGTLDTRTPLFVGMLVGVILILVGLTYFPALALGPFAEGLH